MVTKSLPKLPSLPKATRHNPCDCGCGGFSQNRFVPGHDSKLKGMKIRVERGLWDRSEEAQGDIDAQLEALATAMSLGMAKATAKEMGIEDWLSAAEIEAAAEAAKTA